MAKKLFILLSVLLSSCSVGPQTTYKSFLNFNFVLRSVVDLHGESVWTDEIILLNHIPKEKQIEDVYTDYFDTSKSFINFECKGNNSDNFRCETVFSLVTKDGKVIVDYTDSPFLTSYIGDQTGFVLFEDANVENELGTIYVNSIYWCRWRYNYDIDNDGVDEELTFEFQKKQINPTPLIKE